MIKDASPLRARRSWRPLPAAALTLLALALAAPAAAQQQRGGGQVARAAVGAERAAVVAGLPDVAAVFEKQKDKVVSIQAEMPGGANPFMGRGPSQMGQGSGFIIDPTGYIVTNAHVVSQAVGVVVYLSDNDSYQAQLVGVDEKTDLALLKIEPERPLPAVRMGSSSDIKVGEWVVAIGSPFGLSYSCTTGIISAQGRSLGHGPYDDFIQTDASINPGNSGGPLFNLDGDVIGVNTAIIRNGQGIGFAVPVDLIKTIVPQLRERGYVQRGYIGAAIQEIDRPLAEAFEVPPSHGVLVGSVEVGGPANKAGLRPGDIITHVGASRVHHVQALLLAVAAVPPGKRAAIAFERAGTKSTVTITVAGRPDARRPDLPAHRARRKAKGLVLGVDVSPITQQVAQELGLRPGQGVLVNEVVPHTPAALTLRPGDVILQVGDARVGSADDLSRALAKQKKDRPFKMLVQRDGRDSFVAVRLGRRAP